VIKRLSYWIILIILSLLLVACGPSNMNLSENIMAPRNRILPITGKWVIEDYKLGSTPEIDEDMARAYVGKEALFHEKLVTIGEDICWEPSFQIKVADPNDYLIHRYKVAPEYLNIDQDEVQIVSVECEDQIFNEYIKLSENKLIIGIKGTFFIMEKVAEHIEPELIAEYYKDRKAGIKAADMGADEEPNSSILIGLKSLDLNRTEDGLANWQYRTIFIRRDFQGIASIYEMEDIFLPRKKGFSKVEVDRIKLGRKVNDRIVVSSLGQTSDLELEVNEVNNDRKDFNRHKDDRTLKNILYIGNDYISVEKTHYLGKGERVLELHMIDHLDKERPLKISDVSGEIGREAFMEGAKKAIRTKYVDQKSSSIDLKPNEENFGLFRRSGHWIFRGRLDIVEDNQYSYKDFNIKATPPKELVQYDELPISWNRIKIKIPEAVDAFISPHEDMLVALTHNAMLIYPIDEGEIAYAPEAEIELNSAERVIMSEWAIGKYALAWEEEFLDNKAYPLK